MNVIGNFNTRWQDLFLKKMNSTVLPPGFCPYLAPQSSTYSKDVYEAWGSGGIAYLIIPPILTLIMIAIYLEEIYYLFLKSNSKELRNSVLWILGTHPAIMTIGTIAVFMPMSTVYLVFMYNVYLMFAIYKFYYLIMIFSGGSKCFVEKSSESIITLNHVPCCCCVCLPEIQNSKAKTKTIKWMILQNAILTPIYGALGVLLKSDFHFFITPTNSALNAATILSIFNAFSTLTCMYGFRMLSKFAVLVKGMDDVHAIRWKAMVMQATLFVLGLEGVLFSMMVKYNILPCTEPLNFISRGKVVFNYAAIIQAFFLGLLARKSYRRRADIQRQVALNDDAILSMGEQSRVITSLDAYSGYRNYGGDSSKQQNNEGMHDSISSVSIDKELIA